MRTLTSILQGSARKLETSKPFLNHVKKLYKRNDYKSYQKLYTPKSAPAFYGSFVNQLTSYLIDPQSYKNEKIRFLEENKDPLTRYQFELEASFENLMKNLKSDQELTPHNLEKLVTLENLYRAGDIMLRSFLTVWTNVNIRPKTKVDYEKTIPLLRKQMVNLIERPILDNPPFVSEELGVYGNGDFIIGKTLYEMKCSSVAKFTTKYAEQIISYLIINDYGDQKFDLDISYLGYWNPIYGIFEKIPVRITKITVKLFIEMVNGINKEKVG